MARILSLDECPVSLRNRLVRSLRSLDEAVLLPQAERRDDTGIYKNIVFRLAGNEAGVRAVSLPSLVGRDTVVDDD